MKRSIGSLLFIGLCGVMTGAQSALVYQSDGRYIHHTMAGGAITPAPAYADFNADWWAWEAGAFQTSQLTAAGMSGNGSTYAGFDAMSYGAEATSVFSVTFGVDRPTDFTLTGSLDTGWWGGSDLYVSLSENGTEIFRYDLWTDVTDYGVNPFAFGGQFATGNVYELVLLSYSWDSDYYYETWDFELTTTAVPLPAAVWLLGSGCVGLLGVARRRRS